MVGRHEFGLAYWIYHRFTWAADGYCYLQNLFVPDNARGSELGRGFIEHVTVDAKLQGAPKFIDRCTNRARTPSTSTTASPSAPASSNRKLLA